MPLKKLLKKKVYGQEWNENKGNANTYHINRASQYLTTLIIACLETMFSISKVSFPPFYPLANSASYKKLPNAPDFTGFY